MSRGWVAALLLVAVGPAPAAAQGLADRVEEVDEGWVTFRVQVEPGVRICDGGIRVSGDGQGGDAHGSWGSGDENCTDGPLQVALFVSDGSVRELSGRAVARRGGAMELGEMDPHEASSYLVSLAYRGASREAAEQGFFLAQLPRGADASGGILRAARDRMLDAEVRRSALFWAGQLAAREAVSTLDEVARRDDEARAVRDAAIFALSQHDSGEVTHTLMELALEAPHADSRRTAFFWLAQRDEPGVAEFLADVILGRRGG